MPCRVFIARKEKSMAAFKVLKDRLTLLFRTNAACDSKLSQCLFTILKILQNYAASTLPVLWKWNNKMWMIAHIFLTYFTEYCSFKILLVTTNSLGHSRALMEMYTAINVSWMRIQHPFCIPLIKEWFWLLGLLLKKYILLLAKMEV